MNTLNNINSTMPNMIRKRALYMVGSAILGTIYIATGSNANASNNESELQSSRSSIVNYESKLPKQTKSRNAQGTNNDQQAVIEAFNQLNLTTTPTAEPRKTREQVIAERQHTVRNKNDALGMFATQSVQSGNYVEFGIYTASSRLFEDFDYDGFYQTFSVTFDADVYGQYAGERAYVFADLYLSHDGGPWELYFTTNDFTIIDDISEDEFEVLTTLDLGFRTGHYDVLVDLYEVGYSDIVATISSDDVDDLYALPLESSDRDEYVVVEHYPPEVFISAGSFSISGLLILISVIGVRLRGR
jgi:hypothetical protein